MVFYSGMTAFYRHYCHFPLFPIFWWHRIICLFSAESCILWSKNSFLYRLLSVCNNISPVFITGYMVHQCIGCDAYMLPAILCIYLPPLFFAAIRLRFLKGTASDKKNEASRSQITFKIIDAGIMNGFETMRLHCDFFYSMQTAFTIKKQYSLCQPVIWQYLRSYKRYLLYCRAWLF